jgi:hypothetical protein
MTRGDGQGLAERFTADSVATLTDVASVALPASQADIGSLPVDSPQRMYGKNMQLWNAASAIFLFTARSIAAVLQLRMVDLIWGGSYSGLTALSNQVLLYVNLLELGLAQAAISLLYAPVSRGHHSKASALITAMRSDVQRLAAVGAIVILPLVAAYAMCINSTIPRKVVVLTLICIAVTGLIQLTGLHYQAYLNAAERLGSVNVILGCSYLVKTSVGLYLAREFHQYLFLPASIAVLTVAELFILRLAFVSAFPHFKTSRIREASVSIRGLAKFVVLHRVGGLIYYQSDFIILSITTSLFAVKDYAKFQYISAALLSLVGTICTAMTASVARLQLHSSEGGKRRQYAVIQFSIALIAALLMLSYWFSASLFVSRIFGEQAPISMTTIVLFGVALFLNLMKATDDMVIASQGSFAIGYWIPMVEVICYLSIGIVLSRVFGINGILIASIATNILISVGLKGIVLAHAVFSISSYRWYQQRLWNTLKACAYVTPIFAFSVAVRTPLQASLALTILYDLVIGLVASVSVYLVLKELALWTPLPADPSRVTL